MYLVDIRNGYRCGWFVRDAEKLVMQPHPMSRYAPESWVLPHEAEVIGKVIGVVTRLNESWSAATQEFPAGHAGWNRKAL